MKTHMKNYIASSVRATVATSVLLVSGSVFAQQFIVSTAAAGTPMT